MTKPITPDEVAEHKTSAIPGFVFEAFNNIIARYWNGRRSHFLQVLVVAEIQRIKSDATLADIFDNHWLDVEPVYRDAGWIVEYDRPGFNETYKPSFTFTRKAA